MQTAQVHPVRTAPSKPVHETYAASLPATGYVRVRVVAAVCGIAPSTIWKWCADGKFPKQVKLSYKVSAWPVAQIREWLADPAAWQAAHGQEG